MAVDGMGCPRYLCEQLLVEWRAGSTPARGAAGLALFSGSSPT
jgi:hypothetical protein